METAALAQRATAPPSSTDPRGLKLSEGEGPRIVATFDNYAGMLDAIRARVNELQINGERFDHFAGLPTGYLSKLIGIRPIRRLGMLSFGPVLAALGLRCLFVEDPEGTERLKNQVKPRNPSYVRAMPANACMVLTPRMLLRIRRAGGKARMARLTAKQRSELARLAARARWHGR
jgi:hypothetical protein